MRTVQLKTLMLNALKSVPKPHTEDVIEDVFLAIEANPNWQREYDDLHYNLGKPVVNAWGAFWIAHAEGKVAGEQVAASRSKLLESYAKLVKGPKSTSTKLKEPEALAKMSEYFLANKESLPAAIRKHRDLIVELIKEGFAPADAFSKAQERPALAR